MNELEHHVHALDDAAGGGGSVSGDVTLDAAALKAILDAFDAHDGVRSGDFHAVVRQASAALVLERRVAELEAERDFFESEWKAQGDQVVKVHTKLSAEVAEARSRAAFYEQQRDELQVKLVEALGHIEALLAVCRSEVDPLPLRSNQWKFIDRASRFLVEHKGEGTDHGECR